MNFKNKLYSCDQQSLEGMGLLALICRSFESFTEMNVPIDYQHQNPLLLTHDAEQQHKGMLSETLSNDNDVLANGSKRKAKSI